MKYTNSECIFAELSQMHTSVKPKPLSKHRGLLSTPRVPSFLFPVNPPTHQEETTALIFCDHS